MFDFSKNKDKLTRADELKKGDLVFIHNPFVFNNQSSTLCFGPCVVVNVKSETSKYSYYGPKDAVEIEVMMTTDDTKISTFWGTLWHFYKM